MGLLLTGVLCASAFAADREERFKAYDARRTETLEKMAQRKDLNGALARLYLNKDVEMANRIVLEADLQHWLDHIPQLALYQMFNADTGQRAKLLSREATDKLQAHMWECFQPKHGKGPWGSCRHSYPLYNGDYWGNQNHGFVFQSWFYTAATALKDIPKYTGQFNPEKNVFGYKKPEGEEALTLAGYAEALRQLWRNRFPRMARQGVWAEDKVYRCYSIATTYNLAYHAGDPDIRRRAAMILDLHWLIYALHMVDSQLGGAMNRFKEGYSQNHFDRGLGQYYFGGEGYGFHSTEVALFGDYLPPAIAYDMLADPKKRGCFAYRERLTQFSGPGQPPPTWKCSYVTPEYVLGSYIAHDLAKGPGRYHERAFNGIAFGKARAMLRLGPPVSFQSYHCMQNGPVLLARWYGQELVGKDSAWGRRVGDPLESASIIVREGGGADIKPVVFEKGWLFGEAGDAYFALRAAAGRCRVSARDFQMPTRKSPLVLRAGGVTEDGSFAAFQKRVLDGSVAFTPAWAQGQGPTNVEAVRYTFTAPHFEVGSTRTKGGLMGPHDLAGVTFPAGGGVFPQSDDPGSAPAMAAQHHNVLLLRAAANAPKDMAIRFDLSGPVEKQVTPHGQWWICREGPAYVAVRELPRVDELAALVESEGSKTDLIGGRLNPPSPLKGNRLVLSDASAPVALVAGGTDTFPTREAFLASLDACTFKVANGVLTCAFTDANNKPATLTVGVEPQAVPPAVNGKAIDGVWTAQEPRIVEETKAGKVGLLPLDGIQWAVTYADAKWGKMEFRPYPELPADQWRRIDGQPVALPDKLFDSPYLTSDYDSGVIKAEFNGRKLVLDFNTDTRREE